MQFSIPGCEGPFGKGAPTVAEELQAKGYRLLAPPEGFIVTGKYGPLREGATDRARHGGEHLLGCLSCIA